MRFVTALAGAAWLAATLAPAGCQNSGNVAAQEAADTSAAPAQKLTAQPDRSGEPAPRPALLQQLGAELTPWTGDDLKRASLTFEQVLEQLPVPPYLKARAEAPPTGEQAESASPSAAIRAYVRGRAAYRSGNRWQAVSQLEQAQRLDPNSAAILRLLGKVYFEYENPVKGAAHLTRAVTLDGDDAESLYLLGRFAHDKGNWQESVVVLARSSQVDQSTVDPAVQYLRPYYLGESLMEQGYDAAAVEQFEHYLQLPMRFSRTTRLHQELAFLSRQRGRVHVQLGDALCRLGRIDDGLMHYELASADPWIERHPLLARRLYALLLTGRFTDAEQTLLNQLRQGGATDQTLDLVQYVSEHGVPREQLVKQIQTVYHTSGRSSAMALAVAQLMDDEAGDEFLAAHLAEQPADMTVYRRLMARLAERDKPALVRMIIESIRAQPKAARLFVQQIEDLDVEPQTLLKQIDELEDAALRDSAAAWYVRGALNEAAGMTEAAAQAYEKAFEVDPTFLSPHLATIELQLSLGRFEQALELLDRIAESDDPQVQYARVRVYIGLDRLNEAANLLERLLRRDPRNTRYLLMQARIHRAKQQYEFAERTLYLILDYEPTNEEAFTELFSMYGDRDITTDPSQELKLLRRAREVIPASRIARLKTAHYYARARQYDQAEQGLLQLLRENDADADALTILVMDVYGQQERWAEAEKLLLEHIEMRPDDLWPLRLLRNVAMRLGHHEQYYQKWEDYLNRRESGMAKWIGLVTLYHETAWDKPDKAIAVLEQAIEKTDKDAEELPDLRFNLAMILERKGRFDDALKQAQLAIDDAGADNERVPDWYCFKAQIYHVQQQPDRAESMLLEALKIAPDHGRANNDLGYMWAERNKNLQQALEMTIKAVNARPGEPAYLDSLGWVYYKLGQFQNAVNRLSEAQSGSPADGSQDPVILDHYGDALWRVGRSDDAQQQWRKALDGLADADASRRPELTQLRATLETKLKAVVERSEPPIAPLPHEQPGAAPLPPQPPDPAP